VRVLREKLAIAAFLLIFNPTEALPQVTFRLPGDHRHGYFRQRVCKRVSCKLPSFFKANSSSPCCHSHLALFW
jgi:hypothetical protein